MAISREFKLAIAQATGNIKEETSWVNQFKALNPDPTSINIKGANFPGKINGRQTEIPQGTTGLVREVVNVSGENVWDVIDHAADDPKHDEETRAQFKSYAAYGRRDSARGRMNGSHSGGEADNGYGGPNWTMAHLNTSDNGYHGSSLVIGASSKNDLRDFTDDPYFDSHQVQHRAGGVQGEGWLGFSRPAQVLRDFNSVASAADKGRIAAAKVSNDFVNSERAQRGQAPISLADTLSNWSSHYEKDQKDAQPGGMNEIYNLGNGGEVLY